MPVLPVIVLVGPTAAGKTATAIALARLAGAEVVSADSRQFYKLMDIGTAKPSPAELAQVPHHFIDILPPTAEYSAGEYAREARARIDALRRTGRRVVVVGGSGMYLTALLDGFFAPAPQDKTLQTALKKRALLEGSAALFAELQQVDPVRAAELHPNDGHRIVRALEVYYATGQQISRLRQQPRVPATFPFIMFGLRWPREELYRRIDQRVEAMLAAGFEREVRALLALGFSPMLNAMQTVGYKETVQFLRGDLVEAEMVTQIKQHSRNYAKRQMTWFAKDQRIQWLEVTASVAPAQLAATIRSRVHEDAE